MTSPSLRELTPLTVAAAIAIFAIGWSYTFKDVPPILVRGFQPAAFPRLVAGLILVLSVLAWIEMSKSDPVVAPEMMPPPLTGAFWKTLLALAGFSCLLTLGDLLFALMVATAGLSFAWGERRPLVLLGLGIAAPLAVFVLFDQVFQVRFPRGFLTDLYYG